MAKPPPKKPPDGESEDEQGPATFFVRMDPSGNPMDAPAPPPAQAPGRAPKKGLQVQLPDDDEPAPPPARPKPVAPVANKKGRRGSWWDEKSAAPDEPPPEEELPPEEPEPPLSDDDVAGATAMLRVDAPPPPARRRAAPREAPEPEPEPEESERPTLMRPGRDRGHAPEEQPAAADNSTQFFDLNTGPTPQELRQQAAKEAAKSDAPEAKAGGLSAAHVVAILLVLALLGGILAAALALLK